MKIISSVFSPPEQKEEKERTFEPDQEIAPLCEAINHVGKCRTISSCSQYRFPDEGIQGDPHRPGGGQVYVSIVFQSTESMALVIDAFMTSTYHWKIFVPKRHAKDYSLGRNEVRLIFQNMFDNREGRDREFKRLIDFLNEKIFEHA